ncbi:cilia- and flagella-associated protein 100 isoform X1 [Ornithorhynchus anatinus]|uniref:Cilia and flagella associated protein 100 n=1 Tax=Ornithorhynchus anatinus TaxID=9258 RepID=K7EBI4_ORNAN|nr:cilia- and flagella-associated protein 100 isoform X1 [Ornithorhynchus anatinus]
MSIEYWKRTSSLYNPSMSLTPSTDLSSSSSSSHHKIKSKKVGSGKASSSAEASAGKLGGAVQKEPTETPSDEMEQIANNPFRLPSNIDFFLLRDKAKEKILLEKKKPLKIYQKLTHTSRMNSKQSDFKKAIQREEEEEEQAIEDNSQRLHDLHKKIRWRIPIYTGGCLDKVDIHNYIDQKRQLFLLEFILEVKRDEIQKLDLLMAKEEERFNRTEKYLEKDAAMFDEFLKENDRNSVMALKTAEKETKAKMVKINETRELNAQVMAMKSEIAKLEETLQEYRSYQQFLYKLSPREWLIDHERKRLAAKAAKQKLELPKQKLQPLPSVYKVKKEAEGEEREIQKRQRTNKMPPYTVSLPAVPHIGSSLTEKTTNQMHQEFLRGARVPPKQSIRTQSIRKQSTLVKNQPETQESINSESEDEILELYFTDPQQLLNIFKELEEQNLSLIQNSQETEETLDEIQQTLVNTRIKMDREIDQLKQLANTLKTSILKEEEIAADLELKSRVFSFGEYRAEHQDRMLDSLNKKVAEVYRQCVGENESNLGTLQMLAVIEHQLDDLLECLEKVPQSKIEQAEKVKEKERRTRMREDKLRIQRQLQEERLQRALARAQADVKKKTGRRLTYRSEPHTLKRKPQSNHSFRDKEKEEQIFYFS